MSRFYIKHQFWDSHSPAAAAPLHLACRYLVEVEVVLPANMSLADSHDISLELQHKVEALEQVGCWGCWGLTARLGLAARAGAAEVAGACCLSGCQSDPAPAGGRPLPGARRLWERPMLLLPLLTLPHALTSSARLPAGGARLCALRLPAARGAGAQGGADAAAQQQRQHMKGGGGGGSGGSGFGGQAVSTGCCEGFESAAGFGARPMAPAFLWPA